MCHQYVLCYVLPSPGCGCGIVGLQQGEDSLPPLVPILPGGPHHQHSHHLHQHPRRWTVDTGRHHTHRQSHHD